MTKSGEVIVGEHGKEVVRLPRGAEVSPLAQMLEGPMKSTMRSSSSASGGSMMGGGGLGSRMSEGFTLHWHQNAPIYGILDFEEMITKLFTRVALTGGFRGVI